MVRYRWMLWLMFLPWSVWGQAFSGCPTGQEYVVIGDTLAREVWREINAVRVAHGVKPLIWDEALARAASYHAQDMAFEDYLEHATYDRRRRLRKRCGTFDRLARFVGEDWLGLGENIAGGDATAKDVVAGWLASPPHKAQLLAPEMTHTGVGYRYVLGSTYTHYWVQDFSQKDF